MPLTRAAQQEREADTVRSAPNRPGYHCPNLATVDQYLAKLSRDLHLSSTHPDGQRRIREDIDALLERREWLQWIATVPTETPAGKRR